MKKISTLNMLREGEHGRVTSLMLDGKMRSRLSDLGLIEGTRVSCLQRSSSGDPIAYLIRGAVIALRNDDSSRVMIAPEKTQSKYY